MRIAIVTPYIASILGNRGAFVIARALAERHDVTVVAGRLSARLRGEIESMISPARLEAVATPELPPLRMSHLMWMQLVRGGDRKLARHLRSMHDRVPWDAIFVRSNEGHWIGDYVRRWNSAHQPVTLVGVLDLIDNPFLLRHERSHPTLRTLASIAYPWVHQLEERRLRSFDGVVTNSAWTASLLGYLYGLESLAEIDAFDDHRFSRPDKLGAHEPYIAVPTASLDPVTVGYVERLASEGVPLRPYGPRPSGRVPSAGFLADAEMAGLLAGARATLFLFDYEAFGLIPVESLAVGTPVITLPKGGPYAELRGNPHVRFVTSYTEVQEACRQLLAHPKDDESAAACRASVTQYRPSIAAERLVRAIDAARDGRRGSVS